MRIEKTPRRARRWEYLKEATGESTTSKALDVAADYYLDMAGGRVTDTDGGALDQLMADAAEQGGLTFEEIAGHLDSEHLPVKATVEVDIGH